MSETDDTDELLLIPPDFFFVDSDSDYLIDKSVSYDPYFSVVNSLISQVDNLERKVDSLSEFNCASVCCEDNSTIYMTHNNRKYKSFEELEEPKLTGFWSTQSTPSKVKGKFVNTLNSEQFCNSKITKQESSVSPVKYFNLSPRALSGTKENNSKNISGINNFIKCVKNIQQLENYRENFHIYSEEYGQGEKDSKYTPRNLFASKEPNCYSKVSSWQSYVEKFIKVPQKRDDNIEEESITLSHSSQETAKPNCDSPKFSNSIKSVEDINKKKIKNDKSSQGNAPEENTNSTCLCDHQMRFNFPKLKNRLAFLSLNELWNDQVQDDHNCDQINEGNVVLSQKIEEEKMMRKYCEELVQQLQRRNLEIEEQIYVAIQVDQAKDEAIQSFFHEWNLLQNEIQKIKQENEFLQKKCQDVENYKKNYIERVKSLEDEITNSLMLAHTSQEKVVSLEKVNMELQNKLHDVEEQMKKCENNLQVEINKNIKLLEVLKKKEQEISETKKQSVSCKKEAEESKKSLELCQNDLLCQKNRTSDLQKQLECEREWNKDFEYQKAKLFEEIESHRKLESNLQEEVKKLKESNEKVKIELRNFYQKQVEVVVREKLKEFQEQLEKAENNLQCELRAQEKSFAKAAASHIYQITEKHNMEVHLLEDRHREEIKLYKLQLSQARQQLESTRAKLQRQQERIVEQLYKAMEAQWFEALKVIGGDSSSPSGLTSGSVVNEKTIGDRLNFLKSTSYNSFERILSQNVNQVLANDNNHLDNVRMDEEKVTGETPLSSRTLKSRQEIENELHKYVLSEKDEQIDQENNKNCTRSCKDLKHMKPPWK